jgi:hypothetical protein
MYVGFKKCKTCHRSKKIGNQVGIWQGATHANALKSLSSPEALKYAKENNMGDPNKDPQCLNCHATMATVDTNLIDPNGKLTLEEGVSCESCHGPGSHYKKLSIMKDYEKALTNGLIVPTKEVCISCHNEKNPFYKPFNFEEQIIKINHPIPKQK